MTGVSAPVIFYSSRPVSLDEFTDCNKYAFMLRHRHIKQSRPQAGKEYNMKKVYEFCSYSNSPENKARIASAVAAGKAHKGNKWTVAVGEWGPRTFLVLADTKEEAAALAREYIVNNPGQTACQNPDKVVVRNVTNSKKYN